jgi:hypothetical protein
MASGAIPFVYNAGGHKEIITKENGVLWRDTADLYRFTKKISSDDKFRKAIMAKCMESSKKYSYEEFEKNFLSLL